MELEVSPAEPLIDQVVSLRLRGAPPGGRVEVSATSSDERGATWTASVVVAVDEAGNAEIGAEAPLSGSFTDRDPMGLVWRLAPSQRHASYYATAVDEGVTIAFVAVTRTSPSETAESVVTFAYGRDISVSDVAGERFVGTLYEPLGDAVVGAVAVVPDLLPSATTAHPTAALLATHGYLALVVEYQGLAGFPPGVQGVPLELFVEALRWLGERERTSRDRVGVVAAGKGAEGVLAALVHSLDVRARAVVLLSPSCATWQATLGGAPQPGSSWSWNGEPVPFLPVKQSNVIGQKFWKSVAKQTKHDAGALRLSLAHIEAFKDRAALQRAVIEAERVQAPMLVVTGGDDQVWPSADMADLLTRRRHKAKVDADDRHLRFDKAGHLFRPPFLPTTAGSYLDRDGNGLVLGGEPQASLHANVTTWAEMLDFLREHLG